MPESIRERKERGDFWGFRREPPYAGFIGMDVEIEDGRPLTILRKDSGNIGNPFVPMIHGGAVGALLEHAALMQLFFELELGLDRRPKIVNISIDYLRPCLLEDTFARGSSSVRAAVSPTCGSKPGSRTATGWSRPRTPTSCCRETDVAAAIRGGCYCSQKSRAADSPPIYSFSNP